VGVTIDKEKATERFGQALTLALSDTPLPEEWLERTRRVGRARSKTFTPALGTALLAKATDRFVDAFALREGESDKSYSARSLAKEVFVPCCARSGINIRTKGPEPLNNQPFFHADRISPEMNVNSNAVEGLAYLCECLEGVDLLEERSALEALAAFLRARIEVSATATPVALGPGALDLPQLVGALDEFVEGDHEGGKVGQALATAILDLVFEDVKTKAINDSSSKWPGDVGAFSKDGQTLSVEVKQRAVTEAEVLLFAQRLAEAGLHRGFVVALDQGTEPLDKEQLRFHGHRLHGVELSFFTDPGTLLVEACRYAPRDVPVSLASFPHLALKRMEELEVSQSRLDEWAALFAAPTEDS
jgi:SacI restriction endonuclease